MQKMLAGEWQADTHAIFFDENGHLMDGHTRLTAILKSGVSVEMEIKRNYPRAKWNDLCIGTQWRTGELATARGVKSANVAMGAVKIRECLKRGLRLGVLGATSQGKILGRIWTNDDYVNLYKEELDWCNNVDFAVMMYRSWRGISPAMCAGVIHHLIHDCKWPREFVFDFFRQIYTLDGLTSNTQTLRKRLDFDRGSGMKLPPNYICLLISKAFDGYANNTPKTKLQIKDLKATPKFPKFK